MASDLSSRARAYLRKAVSIVRGRWVLRQPGLVVWNTLPVFGPRCLVAVERGARLEFAGRFTADRDVEIVVYKGGELRFGEDVYIGHGTTIACARAIDVGKGTLIGDLVSIRDMNHRRMAHVPMAQSGVDTGPIRIGENCWLGSKVTVVAGASMGNDVTVGANAVVAGQFGDGCTLGGIPARLLKISPAEDPDAA